MNERVSDLFHQVAELSPDARAKYFVEHHVDDETRREVEALLVFDSGASDFLMKDIRVAASRALSLLDVQGRRCGPYRLLDIVGRGGMGAVYLAERADGEVKQRLAIKLLPLGAGDPQRERFLQERQILASLSHPNIARMLDAGHLDNGQPFLAMEYIDGKPIDAAAVTMQEVTRPSKWAPELKGDLEFIVMKAQGSSGPLRHSRTPGRGSSGVSRIACGSCSLRECMVPRAQISPALLGACNGGRAGDRRSLGLYVANREPPSVERVQEQLGLKLESARVPAEVLVIDRPEKRSEN